MTRERPRDDQASLAVRLTSDVQECGTLTVEGVVAIWAADPDVAVEGDHA